MLLAVVMLAVALLVLVKASSTTINHAVRFSAATGISQLAVGFIIISVATSVPELSVAVVSSAQGEGLLSLGNVLGANIVNLTLIFGLMSFIGFNLGKIYSVQIDQAIILTSFIALALIVFGTANFVIGIFCLITFYLFSRTVMKGGFAANSISGLRTVAMLKSLAYLLGSVGLVIVSAWVVTDNALVISKTLGIAQSIIGATVLALGTTLPELSVGIAAVRKGNISLAIGDTIGSIVSNMTLILGTAALIHPITFGAETKLILGSLIVVNTIFLFLVYRLSFGRTEGVFLVATFLSYLALVYAA